ncbi:hypothetical protein [Alicyclobacillus dauci]|uniref:Sigma-70, region 4 n=1 Tax=Alicyclobacillus dauci TaxID=1475485 RepID=A0ABY6Z9X3_9BACL|nr:hypothetical protein [Alicyclobacillus dauci]WAH39520.1 hypothetical protein NZD86_24445 [Alicyclobacillus dauci]WAH39580.1 hypothetical protein NZD86_24145 [Alicyclobacillus dauci]
MAKQRQEDKTRIELLLENIHKFDTYYISPLCMGNMRKRTPYDIADHRMEIADALHSNALSPLDRQTIAFYYLANLTEYEVGQVVGMSQKAISNRIEDNAERWEKVIIDGDRTPIRQEPHKRERISPDSPFYEWNEDIIHNRPNWWDVPPYIRDLIVSTFGINVPDVDSVEEVDDSTDLRIRKMVIVNGQLVLTRSIYESLWKNVELFIPNGRKNYIRSWRGESVFQNDDSDDKEDVADSAWWNPDTGQYSSARSKNKNVYFRSPSQKHIKRMGKAQWYTLNGPVITYYLTEEELKYYRNLK